MTMPRFDLFRQFPVKWSVWWILMPNLTIIAMWPIGGPAMAPAIFCCGIAAVWVSHKASRPLRIAGMVAIFAAIVANYITESFNIGIENIFRVPEYLGEVDFTNSPEYLLAALLVATSLALAVYFGSKTPNFTSRGQLMMALAGVALLVNIDTVATAGTRGSYKAEAPAGTPIDSAVLQTGVGPRSLKSRNMVIVMVESWGVPTDPYDRKINDEVWRPERWAGKYAVSAGTTSYFGSTTNAEVRELCGAWADHTNFDFLNSRCLPEQFKDAGFGTYALHGFKSRFFDRESWYPIIGFDQIAFDQTLIARGAGFCDAVFAGACDHDVPRQIGELLRRSPRERNFVYWLTVNSHLPVDPNSDLGTDPCLLGTPEWREDFPMLCRSYQVQKVAADALTAEILSADFPEADVLIIGDHMPPFFQRGIRSRFDSGKVPYFYLRNRKAHGLVRQRASAT